MLPVDKNQNDIAVEVYREFCIRAVQWGGTISAEHGIGKLKRPYFELMYPESVLKEMFEIKKVFDENLILNRGNIFPERFYQSTEK
jgi:FAD/FMN-containing dehydrogenase